MSLMSTSLANKKELHEEMQFILKNNGATNIEFFDITKNNTVADYIIIATGTSTRHLVTLRDKVVANLKASKRKFLGSEGEETANWIVVDCESVIIHLFRQEVREYYKIEDIWNKKLRNSNEHSIKED
jgi:ribosome-associated protein